VPEKYDAETEALLDQMVKECDQMLRDEQNTYVYYPPGTRPSNKREASAPAIASPAADKADESLGTTKPAPNPIEKHGSTATPKEYEFPINDPALLRIQNNLKHLGSKELLELLRRITHEKMSSTGDYVPFERSRPMICAISLLLNEKAEIAPRFRPIRKLRKFNTRDARNFSNDLQVIDLHWLSLHGTTAPERQWKSMIQPKLDFKKAARFVEQLKTAANKTDALGLAERTQLMLSVIQSKAVADRWQTIVKGARAVEVALHAIAAKKSSRLDEATIPDRCNEYVALRIGRGSPTAAAEVLPFIAGATTTARAMQKRRDWFIDKGIDTE